MKGSKVSSNIHTCVLLHHSQLAKLCRVYVLDGGESILLSNGVSPFLFFLAPFLLLPCTYGAGLRLSVVFIELSIVCSSQEVAAIGSDGMDFSKV
jgi:hypothetical protein